MTANMKKHAKILKIAIIFLAFLILLGAGFLAWRVFLKNKNSEPDNNKLTMAAASKIGEIATHKLLVQIRKPADNSEKSNGRYERGDVVLVAPADHGFSDAEKAGFLIIKMEITPKQAEILTLALQKDNGTEDPKQNPLRESIKRRKFYLDLAAIGISDDEEKGREIEDQVFKWDVLREKN